jgi:hypothetical protein
MAAMLRRNIRKVMLGTAVAAAASPTLVAEERGTKVIPERPARVFVMAGFDTACKSISPVRITITAAPSQGLVTLHDGQQTTVQYSVSGACIGAKVVGTGIYYTARPGADGTDTFAIAAQIGGGEPVTRTFNVRIAAD